MDPDQTAQMCRLVWIPADRKPIMLVLAQLYYHFTIQAKCESLNAYLVEITSEDEEAFIYFELAPPCKLFY
jgi:hypothetical protein